MWLSFFNDLLGLMEREREGSSHYNKTCLFGACLEMGVLLSPLHQLSKTMPSVYFLPLP